MWTFANQLMVQYLPKTFKIQTRYLCWSTVNNKNRGSQSCSIALHSLRKGRLTVIIVLRPFLWILVQVLMELSCFEPLQRLVCGMFLPQCSPQGGVLQPCRTVCSSAEQQCSQALDLFSFSWPFNCHLLPDSQDPLECSLPWLWSTWLCKRASSLQ